MDVFKPFLQRLTQPIVLSFCIAWIFWNWEISLGFIKYNSETLPKYGYKDYKELIFENRDALRNFWIPFIIAFAYPLIRYGLNWFNAFIRTKERTQLLNVSGTGKMSTLKFLELKKSYDEKIVALSNFFENESQIQTKLNEADTELINARTELQRIQNEMKENSNEQNSWYLAVHDAQMREKETEEIIAKANEKNSQYEKEIKRLEQDLNNLTAQFMEYNDKIYEYTTRSSPSFLQSRYFLNIYTIEKSVPNLLFSSESEILPIGTEIYVLKIQNIVASITSYNYNIIKNEISVLFASKDESEPYSIIFNQNLTFSIDDSESLFKADFELNDNKYRIVFEKNNK